MKKKGTATLAITLVNMKSMSALNEARGEVWIAATKNAAASLK